jgi:phage shock protein A
MSTLNKPEKIAYRIAQIAEKWEEIRSLCGQAGREDFAAEAVAARFQAEEFLERVSAAGDDTQTFRKAA